jgi:HEAT repeat protein
VQDRVHDEVSGKQLVLLVLVVVTAALSAGARPAGQEPTAEGKPVSHWIGELKREDMGARLHASTVLRGMGAAAVPYLVQVLGQDKTDARLRVLNTLDQIGSAAKVALPAISALLRDDSPAVRITAAATIVGLDCERSEEVWPVLMAGLEGDDSFSASIAATTVGSLGADGARAVPALARLVKASDPQVQGAAMTALWKMGPAAKDAVPALEEAAKGAERGAVSALETIKGEAPTPVPPCRERRATQKP